MSKLQPETQTGLGVVCSDVVVDGSGVVVPGVVAGGGGDRGEGIVIEK